MAIPYHTHTFSLPTATSEQVAAGTSDSVVITPASLKPSLDGKLSSVVAGDGISVDNTDPKNPVVSATGGSGTGDVTGPAGATAGNFPALDATGKILSDSGSKPSDFATAADGLLAQSAVQPAEIAGMLETSDIGSLVQAYDPDTAKTDVAQQFSKPQWASATPVTSATTMTIDLADNNDFTLTLGHNATLANPTNQSTHVNQKGTITITQDGTGGRTLSFGANWKAIGSASAPSINTTAGVTSCIDYHVLSSTVIRYSLRAVGAA